jgi:tRNA pseudouridine55 synthase
MVDGVLLLDKPAGLSSNAALQRARRAVRAEHAGHTGTLDPLASGLLPLVLGDAAKFGQAMLDADKEYLARVRLGARTSTGDAEGEVVETAPLPTPDRQALEAVLARFRGTISQVPPMHSALKQGGVPLYKMAREGVEVERAAREVQILELELVSVNLPDLELRVRCSKGTYIRTLAEDVGRAMGSQAHLQGLRRTAVGAFRIDNAVGLEDFEAMNADERVARLLPPDAPLLALPRVDLDATSAQRLRHGQSARLASAASIEGRVRAYTPSGAFLGVVNCAAGELCVVRLVRESRQSA